MYILSFDVASKSLAISIIKFNENWSSEIKEASSKFYSNVLEINKDNITQKAIRLCQASLECINKIGDIVETRIQPIYLDVVDLIPLKKIKDTDLILRSNRLKGYLNTIDNILDVIINDPITNALFKPRLHVLVEYQMGPNNKSNNVFSQILYHYANNDLNFKRTNQHPSIQRKLTENILNVSLEIVGPSLKNKINLDKDRPRTYFIEKYAKTYDANKKHSIANMNYFLKSKNSEHMIANVKKKNLDDIADSITMTLAWLYLKSGFY